MSTSIQTMLTSVRVENEMLQTQFCKFNRQPLDPALVRQQRPSEQWLLVSESYQAEARCSLWWEETPELNGKRVGCIGHFAAASAESAREVLALAADRLAMKGCQLAVGPMDGSTWQSYRAVTDAGDEPPFFLEPDTPNEWPKQFESNGFGTLAEYYSAIADAPKTIDPRQERLTEKLRRQGISIRPIDVQKFDAELEALYPLVMASFAQNLLYTPIDKEFFMAQYQPLRQLLIPQMVLIAEQNSKAVGFVLCLPDLCQQQRGEVFDRAIIKTLAVHPDYQQLGVGGLLAATVQNNIATLGYRQIIHALMHETNHSRTISQRYGKTMRRYALYAKEIYSREI